MRGASRRRRRRGGDPLIFIETWGEEGGKSTLLPVSMIPQITFGASVLMVLHAMWRAGVDYSAYMFLLSSWGLLWHVAGNFRIPVKDSVDKEPGVIYDADFEDIDDPVKASGKEKQEARERSIELAQRGMRMRTVIIDRDGVVDHCPKGAHMLGRQYEGFVHVQDVLCARRMLKGENIEAYYRVERTEKEADYVWVKARSAPLGSDGARAVVEVELDAKKVASAYASAQTPVSKAPSPKSRPRGDTLEREATSYLVCSLTESPGNAWEKIVRIQHLIEIMRSASSEQASEGTLVVSQDDMENLSDCCYTVHSCVDYILTLSREMKNIDRVASGACKVSKDTIIPSGLFSWLEQMAARHLKSGVQLVSSLPDVCPLFLLDAVRLRQVLLDIVIVALNSTLKGHVKFILETSDDVISFVVEDTGGGFSYNSEHANANTSLRMRINRMYVRGMGGTLRVRCVKGVGTACILCFPRAQSTLREERRFPSLGRTKMS